MTMRLDAASEARLEALKNAPKERWIALSSDETRVIASGETFTEVSSKADASGETDPLIMLVPEDWTPRVL